MYALDAFATPESMAVAKILVQHGCDLDPHNRSGQCLLHDACAKRREDVVRFAVSELKIAVGTMDSHEETGIRGMPTVRTPLVKLIG